MDVEEMTNSILDNLKYDESEGKITFKDVRYFLIRPETIIGFQKAVEASIGVVACSKMIYEGGYTGGSLSSTRYKKEFGYSNKEILDFMCRMGTEIGWGKFTPFLDPDRKELIVKVVNSPFAQCYGDSESGVCHMIRGVMAGMGDVVLGLEGRVASEETLCLAKGDSKCEFVIKKKI